MEIAIKVRTSFSCVSSWKHCSNENDFDQNRNNGGSFKQKYGKRKPERAWIESTKKKQVSERTFQTECLDIFLQYIYSFVFEQTIVYHGCRMRCLIEEENTLTFFINENSQRFWWNAFIRMLLARSHSISLLTICSRFTFNAVVSFTKEFQMSSFNSIAFTCASPHRGHRIPSILMKYDRHKLISVSF